MPPPLELGAPVRGGGNDLTLKQVVCDQSGLSDWDDDPYAPAQSLRLRIGEDIDWSDVAGAVAVLQRDDSTKGAGANPKFAARRSVAAAAAPRSSMSASAPAPRKAVAVVIGGLSAAREHGGRRRSPCRLGIGGRARVFAAGDAAVDRRQEEPGSPKVSCLGGVRSGPRPAVGGTSRRRAWCWPWLAASAVTCCFSDQRARRAPGVRGADN